MSVRRRAHQSGDEGQIDTALGGKLRARRKLMGLSLRALADRTGVSASFLSQIERAKARPSLATLMMLSPALEVPAHYFLVEALDPVVRHDQRRKFTIPGSSVVYELLCPDFQRGMEVSLGRLSVGSASSQRPLAHATEEFVLVLEGSLEVELGPRRYHLEAGDSIYHYGADPHRYVAVGDEDAVFLSAISPPIEVRDRPPGGIINDHRAH